MRKVWGIFGSPSGISEIGQNVVRSWGLGSYRSGKNVLNIAKWG